MKRDALPPVPPAAPHLVPPPRTPEAEVAWRALLDEAAAPYRAAGRFAFHFARGKLSRDPVFRSLVEHGWLAGAARRVDIGCGQALLASLVAASARLAATGGWPSAWPEAPRPEAYLGIELMPRDVARATRALAGLSPAPEIACADMREAALPPCETVVILDVLHYVDPAAQAALLARVCEALRQGRRDRPRRLLLRVGDVADARGFAASQWVDRVVTALRGHRVPPTWGRPLAAWRTLLDGLGFAVTPVPMSQGTPFANVLLVAEPVSS